MIFNSQILGISIGSMVSNIQDIIYQLPKKYIIYPVLNYISMYFHLVQDLKKKKKSYKTMIK